MLEKSELLNRRKCEHCSLCERCRAENMEAGWECSHMDTTPFLRQKIFLQGKELCGSKRDVDCVYKYNGDAILAIEIKAQPIANVEADNLLTKLENLYSKLEDLSLTAFVLQVSSRLNSRKTPTQLFLECEEKFRTVGLFISKAGRFYSRKPELGYIRTKFEVVKCKDLTEEYITSLL